ncbi:hypothetical protein D3C81_1385580 [compost metagenome]
MRHAPTLKAAEDLHVRQTLATGSGLQQHFRQHRCIEKPKVYTLTGQWVNGVGRVADQRQTLRHITLGMTLTQRHAKAWVGTEDFAEPAFEGAFERFAKIRVVHGHQAFGLAWRGRPDN